MTSWKEATERYRNNSTEAIKVERDETINRIATQLEVFFNIGQGGQALELLRASGQFIRLAERSDSGHTVVYILNGEGLQRSNERSGMSVAYSTETQQPILTRMQAIEFVEEVASCGEDVTQIMSRINEALNQIAEKAP